MWLPLRSPIWQPFSPLLMAWRVDGQHQRPLEGHRNTAGGPAARVGATEPHVDGVQTAEPFRPFVRVQ
ncbi:hypothetical protein GN956_G22262 [Arapaima gigas]